jgi:hypothetical protein
VTEVLFYHLERGTLEDVLPGLVERTLARNWRALIKCESADRAAALDTLLWTYDDQSFLPHAQAGDGLARRSSSILLANRCSVRRARSGSFGRGARALARGQGCAARNNLLETVASRKMGEAGLNFWQSIARSPGERTT